MTQLSPPPNFLCLDNIEGDHFALVGGKAFRLAMLKQHHFNVPDGLVLTAALFEAHLQQCRLTPLWAGSPDVAVTTESLAWLADTLKTTPLKVELLQQINQQLTALCGSEANSFAVRSSAIDEDQQSHTFAGIHLTELGVPRPALPIAITRCWASALSEAAVQYRLKHSMSIQKIKIAVVIQPMLTPDRAGIGFTRHPVTGNRDELVIEADWGLGERVVSGQSAAWFYRLTNHPPDFPALEQRSPETPTKPEPLPSPLRTELAGQLVKIEALMNEPQDVEWAIQNDRLYFLQSRPIPAPPSDMPPSHLEWTRGSHPEFLPELPSPLFSSILNQTQAEALTFFNELGLDVTEAGPYIKLILGRPYLNLTLLKRVITQVGLNPGGVLHTISHTEPGSRGNRLHINWPKIWQARHILWRVLKQLRRPDRHVTRYNKLVDDINQTLTAPDFNTDSARQINQLRQHQRAYRHLFAANLPLDSAISALTTIGSWLLAPFAQNPAAVVSSLALKDTPAGRDRRLNQDLLTAARQVQADPAREAALRTALAAPQTPLPPELEPILTPLRQKYGNQAVYEADVGQPRYNEDPTPLLQTMWQYVRSGQTGPLKMERSGIGPNWGKLYRQGSLVNRLFPWRLGATAWLVGSLRRFLLLREVLNRARGRAMTTCRRWDLALGEFWVKCGWLSEPQDVFWLTLDEIERALLIGDEAGHALSAIVPARRETYQTYADTVLPYQLQESQIPQIQLGGGLAAEGDSTVMMGLPISPGQVQGTVQVWTTPTSFEQVPPQTVLVLPSTDPAFLPLLHLAEGLIVEKGGLLSHGSVIAREYGLPAVANIAGATKNLRTGDPVLLDGSTGIVQILWRGED